MKFPGITTAIAIAALLATTTTLTLANPQSVWRGPGSTVPTSDYHLGYPGGVEARGRYPYNDGNLPLPPRIDVAGPQGGYGGYGGGGYGGGGYGGYPGYRNYNYWNSGNSMFKNLHGLLIALPILFLFLFK